MKVDELLKKPEKQLTVIPANGSPEKSRTFPGRKAGTQSFQFLVLSAYCLVLTVFLSSCAGLKEAREIKEAPMPPKYVETKNKESFRGEGSLCADRASFYEDKRARRVNDIVTILITETTAASKKSTTNTSRDSSMNDSLGNSLGIPNTAFAIKNLQAGLSGTGTSTFKGEGDTARTGTFTAVISAKVVEELSNGNLVIESRKETVINNDKEIIALRGIIRPEDISTNNTILSQNV